MSQNGVDVQINFARELQNASAAIQATPEQLTKAGQRAIKKTMRWVKTRIARELSQVLGVSQKALKPRFSLKTVGKGVDAATILFLGTDNLGAEKSGNARTTKHGVTVGKRKYESAFYTPVSSGNKYIFKRKTKARLPIEKQVIEVGDPAAEVFKRFETRIPAEFSKILAQELNYVVNHERS